MLNRRQFLAVGLGALAWERVLGSVAAQSAWSPEVDLMYYPWWGGRDEGFVHWRDGGRDPATGDIAANYFPKRWPNSSRDLNVLEWHCRLIQRMGVRHVALSYWGRGSYEDQVIPLLMRLLPEYGIRASFHIEAFERRNHGFRFKEEVLYLLSRYGGHPAFYRDPAGRPLFYVWASHLPPTQLYADDFIADGTWRRMLDELRAERGPMIFLAQTTDIERVVTSRFHGLYFYGPFFSRELIVETTSRAHAAGLLVSGSVSPGYDDRRARQDPGRATIDRDQGRFYIQSWETVRQVRPDRINITSFNEWHEGTQIEPARKHYKGRRGYSNYSPVGGYFYIDETQRQIARLRSQ